MWPPIQNDPAVPYHHENVRLIVSYLRAAYAHDPPHPDDRFRDEPFLRNIGDRWCMVVVSSCREMLG